MRFLADENFHNDMLRGLFREYPDLDIVRVQDTEFMGVHDQILLEEAAKLGAILLTHDVNTMIGYAYDRVKAGMPMPGIIEVIDDDTSLGQIIEDLLVMIVAGKPSDFENQVKYVPMR